jgi:hypothetical protein
MRPPTPRAGHETALKQLQREKPAYTSGATQWWAEVIRRTAIGAGADSLRVDSSLERIVPELMHRFSSREGYRLFDDTLSTRAYCALPVRPAVRAYAV